MKPENFEEAKWLKRINLDNNFYGYRNEYLNRHPSFLKFEFPKYFYFKALNDRCAIHWAVIKEEDKNFVVYFIDVNGKAFDKLEFKTKKQAQRALRRNDFYFSTNKKCPYLPVNPIYVRLGKGKKSAPYSKGNLWDKTRENLVKIPPLLAKPQNIQQPPHDDWYFYFKFILALVFVILLILSYINQ